MLGSILGGPLIWGNYHIATMFLGVSCFRVPSAGLLDRARGARAWRLCLGLRASAFGLRVNGLEVWGLGLGV